MARQSRLISNKENAKKSTGPKSKEGKKISSQNARKLGLAVSIESEPEVLEQIRLLAQILAGPNPSKDQLTQARLAAQAQYEYMRACRIRNMIMQKILNKKRHGKSIIDTSNFRGARKIIFNFLRKGKSPDEIDALLMPQDITIDQNISAISLELIDQLSSTERYIKRALSKRKFALRALSQSANIKYE